MLVPAGAAIKDVQCLHALGEGVEVLTYPLQRRSVNPWHEWRSLYALWQVLREEQADIIFASTIKPILYAALVHRFGFAKEQSPQVYACFTGLGYVFEEAKSLPKKLLRLGVSVLLSFALHSVRKVFFQNKDDRDFFLQQGIIAPSRKDKCRLCRGCGVNVRHFALHTSYPERLTFLLMGRLLEAKGIHDFVTAARILRGSYPEVRFQLLGPPETGQGSIAMEQIQAWHEEGSIEYLGQAEDVRPYIANASVLVLPSWREGTPTAILEGMSMGRAAVVSHAPGCREAVKEGENGFLVPPKDPLALVAALERFILAPQLIPHMGAKGRKRAEVLFDAELVAHALLQEMDA